MLVSRAWGWLGSGVGVGVGLGVAEGSTVGIGVAAASGVEVVSVGVDSRVAVGSGSNLKIVKLAWATIFPSSDRAMTVADFWSAHWEAGSNSKVAVN